MSSCFKCTKYRVHDQHLKCFTFWMGFISLYLITDMLISWPVSHLIRHMSWNGPSHTLCVIKANQGHCNISTAVSMTWNLWLEICKWYNFNANISCVYTYIMCVYTLLGINLNGGSVFRVVVLWVCDSKKCLGCMASMARRLVGQRYGPTSGSEIYAWFYISALYRTQVY